ncbi:MAG: hypothetical protein CL946_06670 [Ectothiorhodospiraceae bacterium]|nr:hypothetical protein [Ectothiorhodospiraceae bacterium]
MNNEQRIEKLKEFALIEFGSLRQMSYAVGKSQNYFSEYLSKGKMPPPAALKQLEKYGLEIEEYFDQKTERIELPSTHPHLWSTDMGYGMVDVPGSASEEYKLIEFYGGKPDWDDLPEEVRAKYEQEFNRMEFEIDSALDKYQREVQRARFELDERRAEAVHAFRKYLLESLLNGSGM